MVPTDVSFFSSTITVSLSASGNGFTGTIPSVLGQLSSMRKLFGRCPPLLYAPCVLTVVVLTEQIWLSSNALTGTVPSELGNLTNLSELLSPMQSVSLSSKGFSLIVKHLQESLIFQTTTLSGACPAKSASTCPPLDVSPNWNPIACQKLAAPVVQLASNQKQPIS